MGRKISAKTRTKKQVDSVVSGAPYNGVGLLDPVGFTTSFNSQPRQDLKEIVEPLVGGSGFTGRGWPPADGAPAINGMALAEADLVAESEVRSLFRRPLWHGTKFSLASPEKASRLYF